MGDSISRDPRRRFSEAQRIELHMRQQGKCAVCGEPLPDDFHAHHVIPWALGGPTETPNGLAVCPVCHRVAPLSPLPGVAPREWQSEALRPVLDRLTDGGFTTVSAAPGAGKTLFAGMVVRELLARGCVDRVSVLVPNANLRTQWAKELQRLGIQLQVSPRYIFERADYIGTVMTYGKLHASWRQLQSDSRRTLYILDEVHHLGRDESGNSKAWAEATGNIVGTVDAPLHPVLNLTGTPFRSVANERIGTCRYRRVGSDQIELVTDYQVTSNRLIDQGHLRHLQVHTFDAGLQILNLQDGDVAESRVADLDQIPHSARGAALRKLIEDREGFVEPVLGHLSALLDMQQEALNGTHPLKGLVICDTQRQADRVHQIAMDHLQLPPSALLKATSDEGRDAHAAIEAFRTSRRPAILVAVRMVSEGFDAPDVSAIAYMSRWTAPLFISQMVARAMRVTMLERELGRIPAEVIIPGDPAMVKAFREVLVDEMRLLEVRGEPCPRCARPAGACYCLTPIVDKVCGRCGLPRKICPCPKVPGATPPTPLVQVEVTDVGQRNGLMFDGNDIDLPLLDRYGRRFTGADAVHAPMATRRLQEMIEENPYMIAEYLRSQGGAA